ncbi:MAG: hypothetical protein P8127_12960 [Acidobacteriota bacterium]
MQATKIARHGFRIACRHKKLVLALWLVPLVPALVIGLIAGANLSSIGRSLFSDRVLAGDWFVVFSEFRASPDDALSTIVTVGLVVMAVLTLFLQVALSAGIVETLLERPHESPFWVGIRRNYFSFLRTAGALLVVTLIIGAGSVALRKGFFKLAETQANGWYDIVGLLAAFTVFILLWSPFDLAADLSRVSAARHDDRSMLKGFFRGWWTVIRRPGLFIPLYLVFLLLPVALHAIYALIRSLWTPGTALAIVILLAAQQTVMLIRAFFKLGFWGAEVSAFHALDEPRWCRKKHRPEPVVQHTEVVESI